PIGKLILQDCAPGDRPRRKHTDPLAPEMTSDCCIGVIGGADGPTACSSLHFEPIADVEWRMVFQEKMAEDVNITLLE
ncbi:MAG: hypothetical protein RR063_12700, partial [Anaerovoracaceae bacterium]